MPHAPVSASTASVPPEMPPPPRTVGGDAALLPWSWLFALAALQLLLDVVVAPRTMGEGDAAEFTLALALGGVPHPSGYPLYTMLGHVFVRVLHALGCAWPLAANLWSAAGATLAVALTAALADRLLPAAAGLGRAARLAVIAAGALALAANPVFLRAATQAEVYSWHVAWVAAAALLVLTAWRALERESGLTPRRVRAGALGWGLLIGAGFAHHLTAVWFAIPLGLLLALGARRARRLDPAVVLAFLGGLLVPLLSYGFIAWRALHPPAFQWPLLEPSAAGVFAHATGEIYRTFVGRFAPSDAERSLLLVGVAPVVLPGLVAAATTAWRARRSGDGPLLLALTTAAALQAAFALRYGVIDPSAYFLPVMVVAIALGTRCFVEQTSRLTSPALARGFAVAAVLLVAAAWVPPEFAHARRVEAVDREVLAAFRALPFSRGIVVWHSDSYVRLRAQQVLEGEQSGLVVINPAVLTWAPARREQARALGFDPLAGLRLETDRDLAAVPANIARQSPLPVVDFAAWWAQVRGRERIRP